MIRILAICKRSSFIKGIQPYLLTEGINIIAICNNGADGLDSYQKEKPDIILMDANWSYNPYGIAGAELIRQLKAVDTACKIIISTNVEEPDTIERLKKYQVNGYFYLSMDNVLISIVNCINKVYEGGVVFCQ